MSELLYITATMPRPAGNGAAMRAFAMVEALARIHTVTCLVVPIWGRQATPPELAAYADVRVVDPSRPANLLRRLLQQPPLRAPVARALAALWPHPLETLAIPPGVVARALAKRTFDAVHVFRWQALPLAAALRHHGPLTLDLDDLEPDTLLRFAALAESTGDALGARAYRAEAQLAAAFLATHLPRCARVLVCSDRDQRALAQRFPALSVVVAPNIIRDLPPTESQAIPPCAGPPHRLLFVGTFGYAPNVDGLQWFARELLPELRRLLPAPFVVDVVGSGSDGAVHALGPGVPEVRGHGQVPSVSPYLAAAHVSIAPIRVGGGTRIKILESLAHARPVVTTTIGAEGLTLDDGVHLVLADSAPAFARACRDLLLDPTRAAAMGTAGLARVSERYSRDALARALATDDRKT